MKRAVLGILLVLTAAVLPCAAWAGCADDIAAIKQKMPDVKDEARRKELQMLIEKAEKDDRAGRAKLCDDSVKHAQALLQ